MARKIFIDTSAWISYSLSGQPKHSTIKNIIRQFIKEYVTICTSNDVIDETITRFIYSTNIKIAKKFINLINDGAKNNNFVQLWVDEEIQTQAFELVQKYSEHSLSLTDATTIALMQKFSIEEIVSLDSDFKKVGISTLP
ncbi:type II toxin-antitoxin system VapC family toxin [Candidatus Daviesbacteria bacterium]|nr:type II toxin-antitoxin system VapC family toxin [Candidatus Daviesbacteria bacterium]